MGLSLPLTLAQDWVELIVVSIGLIIFVGGTIANALKKQGEKSQAGGARPTVRGGGASNMPSLDELAARRRQQLQELARMRQRGKGGAPSASARSGTPPQPARSARPIATRSGESSSQRAAGDRLDMREQRRRDAQAAQLRADPAEQAARARREQTADAQQAQQRTREAAMRRRRELAEQARRQQAQRAAPPPRRPAPLPPRAGLGAGVTEVDLEPIHGDLDVGESVVHRHVTDVAKPTPHFTRAHFMNMNRNTLRAAILLKEIIDKPVGLRDGDPGSEW